MKRRWVLWLAGLILITGAAKADDEYEPGRGVARLSVIHGDVSVKRGDSGDWVAAVVNGPLVGGDSVLTGSRSRAEIQLDWAHFARLGEESEVRLAELDYRRYLLQMARGTLLWSVLRDSEAMVEISLPSVSVRPLERGLYRVDVSEDGSARLTVRNGRAEVYTPRGSQLLRAGRTMYVRGAAGDPEFRIEEAVERDGMEEWARSRDKDLLRVRSYHYVSRTVYGVEDLDAYGDWIYVAPYGYVWAPRVVAHWTPYYYGRWVWLDWYGWTWVSYDPWGWAPYHYGRWFWHSNRWCWWPGGIRERHYWRPALVAWIGFGGHGSGVGFGFSFGRIGWVPLAPYEPFYPWYGRRYYGAYAGRVHIDNSITVVNRINITNVYRNARISHAITSLDAQDFTQGRFGRAARLDQGELRQASLVQGALPMAPSRELLRYSDREVHPPQSRLERSEPRFYSSRTAMPVERVPFEHQRSTIEAWSRRGEPSGAATTAGGRGGAEGPGAAAPGAPGRGREPAAGAARPGEAPREGIVNAERGGWRRVGEAGRTGGVAEPAVRTGRSTAGVPLTERDSAAQGEAASRETGRSGWRSAAPPTQENHSSDRSWSRFGAPRGAAQMAPEDTGSPGEAPAARSGAPRSATERGEQASPGSGWRRFGDPARGYMRGEPAQSAPEAQPSSGRSWGRVEPDGRPATGTRGEQRREIAPRDAPQPEPGSHPGGAGREAVPPARTREGREAAPGRGRNREGNRMSTLEPDGGWVHFSGPVERGGPVSGASGPQSAETSRPTPGGWRSWSEGVSGRDFAPAPSPSSGSSAWTREASPAWTASPPRATSDALPAFRAPRGGIGSYESRTGASDRSSVSSRPSSPGFNSEPIFRAPHSAPRPALPAASGPSSRGGSHGGFGAGARSGGGDFGRGGARGR